MNDKTKNSGLARVAFATAIGSTIEWYDFFLYAYSATSIFAVQYFSPLGDSSTARLISLLTVGISFIFRPIGGFIAGNLGDLIGRRPLLIVTLICMGTATTCIGLVPNYAAIGLYAPLIIIILRVFQGLSAGGEWGGAALMAVEHAPTGKRGFYGAFPQLGIPIASLLASGALALMRVVAGDEFSTWGWRIPFYFSVLLIFVGYWIRRKVDETPVFVEIEKGDKKQKAPLAHLFVRYAPLVIISGLVFAGNQATGQLTTGSFLQTYAREDLGINATKVELFVCVAAIFWGIFIFLSSCLSDRIGRRNVFTIGFIVQAVLAIALFPVMNIGTELSVCVAMSMITLGTGFTYGSLPAFYAELFPASVRYSGVSIAYQVGAVFGGAFSPYIADALLQATGGTNAIVYYLLGTIAVGLICNLLLQNRKNIDLSPANEENQSKGIYSFQK